MNKVILTGNLVRDPELRRTMNGTSVASGTIAVSRDRKEPDGTYATDFINWVAWDKTAEYITAYGRKGDRVELSGRWQVRQYDDKNGQKQTVNEVIIENVTCLSKKVEKSEDAPAPAEAEIHQGNLIDNINDFADDDLPF